MDEAIGQLEVLYRAHGPALLRYLRRMAGSAAGAEDLLHETFVQALRHTDRLSEAVSPRAWLFTVARNLGITALRRQRRVTALSEDVPVAEAEPEDPRREAVRQAILALPDAQREALELRLRHELSYEEIAAITGVPIGTVRSRLHHAVRRLRETVGREE